MASAVWLTGDLNETVVDSILQDPELDAASFPILTSGFDYAPQTCKFGSNKYTVFAPRDWHKITTCLVYFPSTECEEPPRQKFTGSEIVLSPVICNSALGGKPWKQPVPDWIIPWLVAMQQSKHLSKLCWSLVAFSRGASWGLEVSAHVSIFFDRAVLMAPYMQNRWSDYDKDHMVSRLKIIFNNLLMVYGSEDYQPCNWLRQVGRVGIEQLIVQGLGHKALFNYCIDNYWNI